MQFESAYIAFIENIREAYGRVIPVFLVCGPMTSSLKSCPYIENVAQAVEESYYIPMNGLLNAKDFGVRLLHSQELLMNSLAFF
jgi:hypothetical protein